MEFGKSYWYNYRQGSEREWLLTNGIGGYASLSLIGSNSRRYHGLLIAALKPPTSRHLMLSNVLEDIVTEDGRGVPLSSFLTKNQENEEYINLGFEQLQRVDYEYLPEYTFNYKDIFIKKKIAMKYGENTTVVLYQIRNGAEPIEFKLTPLVNFRDHHYESRRGYLNITAEQKDGVLELRPAGSAVRLSMNVNDGQYHGLSDCYFYGMTYTIEQGRGFDSVDDHYIPGYYTVKLKPWESKIVSFVVTCESKGADSIDAQQVISAEEKRMEKLIEKTNFKHQLTKRLVLSADNFIVFRESTKAKTVIAGYPWFTDWGRDTMIAFSGLTLTTGRFEDAKEILYTFSKYVKYGLIPNVFPDDGEQPAYNSVDAALWYFEAVFDYLKYTGDYDFIKTKIYGCLKDISHAFREGTLYDIAMAEDGLVTAGNERTQLTWMDVKVGDWVVTPRHGKAVEINALWYNSLMIMSELAQKFKDNDIYLELAHKVKNSFERVFWNEADGCLYDVVNKAGCDSSIRPNQILATGLSFAVIEGEKAKLVIDKVWKELYTPYGLRTLSKDNSQYRGEYSGDVLSRDGAYHQGTVWSWPLGRFIKSFVSVNECTDTAKKNAMDFILPFIDHIRDGGLGSISEIFDGNNPHYPRGCFAQAWSVAEILRAAVEDVGIED